MTAQAHAETVHTMQSRHEIDVNASLEATFAAVLEELGPGSELPDGTPFPMKIEPWPGGRWYRDLGGDAGHLWGHVQVIKPPKLLELCGPMPMSYPAVNHVQYRLAENGAGTRLTVIHRSMGMIPPEHRDGMDEGWAFAAKRIKQVAERKHAAAGGNGAA